MKETPAKTLTFYAGGGIFGLILTGILTFQVSQYKLRTSDFNILMLHELTKHPKLLDLLGEPIRAGNVYSREVGSIKSDNVDCVVPIEGMKTDGLIKYRAEKFNGEWIIRKMEFTFLDEAGGVLRLVKDE